MEPTITAVDPVWWEQVNTLGWASCDCYDVLGQRVMVRCTSLDFAAKVRRLLSSFPTCGDDGKPADLVFSMVIASPSSDPALRPLHYLFRDNFRAGHTTEEWQIFRFLECQLDILLAERVDDPLLLHAGGVSRDGAGIIMPGPSGSGKSSLTLALLQNGYDYCSDEIAVIDSASGKLDQFPKPLSIKNKSIFPHLAQRQDLWFGPESEGPGAVWHIHTDDLGLKVAGAPVPVRYVIFPRRSSQRGAELMPLSSGEALKELVSNSINFTLLGGKGFHLLSELVENSKHFYLKSGDLEASVSQVNQLLDSQA